MPIEDEKAIWRAAHDIASREIERIRNGKWGGGHEPNPEFAAAIANFAIARVAAEREACAKIAADYYRHSTFNSRVRSLGQDAADGIAAAIRNRSN